MTHNTPITALTPTTDQICEVFRFSHEHHLGQVSVKKTTTTIRKTLRKTDFWLNKLSY